MKNGQRITILPSVSLEEMGLKKLAGRNAIISEILVRPNGSIRGCWVVLEGKPFQGEQEWYIPFNSLLNE